MIPVELNDKMLTARDVQIIVDIKPLLQNLSALERVHEDRSLPTMALVIGTVQKFHTTVGAFLAETKQDVLREYGNALLEKAASYFTGALPKQQ